MKKLFLGVGLTLLLASCGGDKSPPAATVNSVSGKVVEALPMDETMTLKTTAWTGGAGQVIAKSSKDGSELARGTLNADGSFSLTLPTSVSNLDAMDFEKFEEFEPDNSTGNLTCTGTPSISNKDAKGVTALLGVDANKDGLITPRLMSATVSDTSISVTGKNGGLIYVDRDVQMTGTQTCTGVEDGVTETATLRLAANLKAGWNAISMEYSMQLVETSEETATISTTVSLTSGSLPTNDWVFGNVASPLSLKSSFGPLR